jgi:MoaA/NifB/PqqE/SkfB family radical SAM enzyme
MEFSVFRKLIDETAGSPIVSLTGGETLLNPKIADFIAYAKNNGRFCTMVTNGWMLAKRAEEICEAGLDNLVVSVDGPRETHTAVRGAKSFDRLVEGIKTILEQTNRPNVIVSTAISNINYNKLVQVYELAQSWGVDGMNFNHLWMQTSEIVEAYNSQSTIFPVSEVAWSIKPGDVDVAKLADEIETIRRRNWGKRLTFTETPYLKRDEIAVWYKKPEQFVKWDTATCAWNHLRVWPDGNVRPCRTWEVGNIAKQHAMEIWNGKEIRNLRQTLAENGALAICARCCLFAYR